MTSYDKQDDEIGHVEGHINEWPLVVFLSVVAICITVCCLGIVFITHK